MKIFIVEDDLLVLRALKKQLSPFFHAISSAVSYAEAMDALSKEQFDCIICDHHLGSVKEEQGLQLVKKLREKGDQTSVILLTGRSLDEISPWEALNSGVDDFIKKPYNIDELVARIYAVHRRCFQHTENATNVIRYKNISINISTNQVFIDEHEIKLRGLPVLILKKFLENPRKLIPYNEIVEYLWGDSATMADQSINSLRVHICGLKQALNTEGKNYIVNVHGVGYVFDEEIE